MLYYNNNNNTIKFVSHLVTALIYIAIRAAAAAAATYEVCPEATGTQRAQ